MVTGSAPWPSGSSARMRVEALLLVEAGDRLALQAPGIATLLERGVAQQAPPLQPLVEQAVLGLGQPELLAIRQDHAAKLERTRKGSGPG